VSEEISVHLAPAAISMSPAASRLRAGGVVVAGSVFVAVCAHLVLPLSFTPAPLSMAPFAVLLLGLLLRPRLAAATLAAYLAEGAMGLPVFAPNSPGGPAHLLGPTGGYLLAYPLAAGLISYLWRRSGRGFAWAAVSATAGDLLILCCGGLWLSALTHGSVRAAMTLGVLPFLPGDVLKITAAAGLAIGWERWRRRRSA